MFSNQKDINGQPYCHIGGNSGVKIYAPCGNGNTNGGGGNGSLSGNAPTYSVSGLPVLKFTPPTQWNEPSSFKISPISFANPLDMGTPSTGFLPIGTPPPIPNLAPLFAQKEREAIQQQAIEQHAEEVRRRQLDIAASQQYKEMDKLYKQGGLDEMRKEYYRLCGGTEGSNSVYARAAYNALCVKEKEEASIREPTTVAANKYYNEGGIEHLKYLINYYKSCGEFNYTSVAQSVLTTKEKEETINTPAVTDSANNYYETGGIESLKHLVKYYEENSYPVNANIAKRILRQKEEQEREEEHNRRMGQDLEYAENYKVKEAENEIRKLEKGIEEQKKIDPFYGQASSVAINERIKAFEYTKNLSYEGAKTYLAELSLPANARFENSKIGAAIALQYYFDKVTPLQNKIEQEKAKIQEIENIRVEREMAQQRQAGEQFQKIDPSSEEPLKEVYVVQKMSGGEIIKDSSVFVELSTKEERENTAKPKNVDEKKNETFKAAVEGIKEAFVETGTFIGEEAARLHLGEKTKIGQVLDKVTTFVEEEKQRFDNDEPTETVQALKEVGSYIKKEGELIVANEKTQTEQFVRDTYQEIKDTPANKIAHDIGKLGGEMLIGYGVFKGATKLVNESGKIINAVNGYNRETRAVKHSLGNNPFRGKSFDTIDRILDKKGFTTKGKNPKEGIGAYFHPISGRKYYLDKAGEQVYKNNIIENPHVDVHRKHPTTGQALETMKDISDLNFTEPKRKYPLGNSLYSKNKK